MENWVEIFRDFVYRDIFYVIGGSTVIISFFYMLDVESTMDLPSVYYIYGAGISYVIGYALQDGLSLTGFVTMSPVKELSEFWQTLYRRFSGNVWENITNDENLENAYAHFRDNAKPRTWYQYQRIIALKHVGTTMSASGFVSSLILLIKSIYSPTILSVLLLIIAVSLSLLLRALGKIKGAQQTRFVMRVFDKAAVTEAE